MKSKEDEARDAGRQAGKEQHDAAKRMEAAAQKTGEPERDPNLTAEVAGRPADEKRAVAQAKLESTKMAAEEAAARGAEPPAQPAGPTVTHSVEQALHELTFPASKDRIIAVARAAALEQTERFKLERIPDAVYPDMESLRRAVNQAT